MASVLIRSLRKWPENPMNRSPIRVINRKHEDRDFGAPTVGFCKLQLICHRLYLVWKVTSKQPTSVHLYSTLNMDSKTLDSAYGELWTTEICACVVQFVVFYKIYPKNQPLWNSRGRFEGHEEAIHEAFNRKRSPWFLVTVRDDANIMYFCHLQK